MEDNIKNQLNMWECMEYCVDPNADIPIMLINKDIGDDEDDVNGAKFQSELLYLDSLEKEAIEIWINSGGGSVIEGYNIASTMLLMKTPIITKNIGICASMAGVIFMCGNTRIMMDYSLFMMHPVSGGSNDKSMILIQESLAKLIAEKSNLSVEDVSKLMDITTWLTASECKVYGICTEIESVSLIQKQTATNDLDEIKLYANSYLNKNIKTNMIKISNKLSLDVKATEDNIIDAITDMQNKLEVLTLVEVKYNNLLAELEEVKIAEEAKLIEDARLAEENILADEAKAVEDARLAEEVKIAEMVNSYAELGKVDKLDIDKWINLAKVDINSVKEILEKNPINKAAKDAILNSASQDLTPKMGDYMFERLNNLNKKDK